MKKLLISLLLIMPIGVFAKVDQNTTTTIWNVKDEADAKSKCTAATNQNGGTSISNATAGYYLECIEVSCTNNKNVHKKLNTYSVSCANGNSKPNAIIDAGAPASEIKEGASCTDTGAYVYFTQKHSIIAHKTQVAQIIQQLQQNQAAMITTIIIVITQILQTTTKKAQTLE